MKGGDKVDGKHEKKMQLKGVSHRGKTYIRREGEGEGEREENGSGFRAAVRRNARVSREFVLSFQHLHTLSQIVPFSSITAAEIKTTFLSQSLSSEHHRMLI